MSLDRAELTILLVEDDEHVRGLVRQVLEREHHTVLVAANGTEGLEVARNYDGAIDLLLSDVMMPGLCGREMVDLIREHRPTLPVLFMTGYVDQDATTFGALGVREALLLKPFRPGDLIARIRKLLEE